jgi:hypothetical protein
MGTTPITQSQECLPGLSLTDLALNELVGQANESEAKAVKLSGKLAVVEWAQDQVWREIVDEDLPGYQAAWDETIFHLRQSPVYHIFTYGYFPYKLNWRFGEIRQHGDAKVELTTELEISEYAKTEKQKVELEIAGLILGNDRDWSCTCRRCHGELEDLLGVERAGKKGKHKAQFPRKALTMAVQELVVENATFIQGGVDAKVLGSSSDATRLINIPGIHREDAYPDVREGDLDPGQSERLATDFEDYAGQHIDPLSLDVEEIAFWLRKNLAPLRQQQDQGFADLAEVNKSLRSAHPVPHPVFCQ